MGSWLGTNPASDGFGARSYLAGAYDSSANLVYAIDGYNGSANQDAVYAYSYSSNTWTSKHADTVSRDVLSAAYDSSANLTYAIDGYIAAYTADIYAYSESSNTWTSKTADGGGARGNLGAAYDSSANLTYSVSGYTGSADTNKVYAYAESSNTWTSKATDGTVRDSLGAAYDSSANLTYSIDGVDGSTVLDDVYAYSEGSNTWTSKADDSISRVYPATAYDSTANLTYAIDGATSDSGTPVTPDFYSYSEPSNAWSSQTSDPQGGREAAACAYDSSNSITYVISGTTNGSVTTDSISTVTGYQSAAVKTVSALLLAIFPP